MKRSFSVWILDFEYSPLPILVIPAEKQMVCSALAQRVRQDKHLARSVQNRKMHILWDTLR
ncbi:MAG: hypothetical protein WA959_21680 [Rivularia sp. (in: cyanobacteria)]